MKLLFLTIDAPIGEHILVIMLIGLLFKAALYYRSHEKKDKIFDERLMRLQDDNDPSLISSLQDYLD